MDVVINAILISLTAILVENTVFSKALGTSTLFLAARSRKKFFTFGLCITYFSVVSSVIAYFADYYFRENEYSYIFMPLVYVVIIGVVYTVTLLVVWKLAYPFFLSIKKFIHISAFNCAVLGVAILMIQKEFTLLQSVVYSAATAIGFALAMVLFAGIRERLEFEDVPEAMKGTPIALVTAALLAMAFLGFSGLV
jgi:electron transport complex protein RnfA